MEFLSRFAEYLLKRGIPYDSEEALKEIDTVMGIFNKSAVRMTRNLAIEKGVFPGWSASVYAAVGDARRNAFLSSCAPTGSTAMTVPNTTGGIEPVFSWAYVKKNIMGGMALEYNCHPLLEKALRDRGILSSEVLSKIVAKGSIQSISEIPEDIRRVFRCSHDISP